MLLHRHLSVHLTRFQLPYCPYGLGPDSQGFGKNQSQLKIPLSDLSSKVLGTVHRVYHPNHTMKRRYNEMNKWEMRGKGYCRTSLGGFKFQKHGHPMETPINPNSIRYKYQSGETRTRDCRDDWLQNHLVRSVTLSPGTTKQLVLRTVC